MSAEILLSASGPLPLKASFVAPVGAPPRLEVTFVVSGSAFSTKPSTTIGVQISDETHEIKATAQIYANYPLTHLALVPGAFRRVALPGHVCEVNLAAVNGDTTTNQGDTFLVMAYY